MQSRKEKFRFLDSIDAAEKMRKGEMRHSDAVELLREKFDDEYTAANTTVYVYRKKNRIV